MPSPRSVTRCSVAADASADRRELLRDVAESLTRLPYTTWAFGDSVAFDGLVAASDVLGDDRWMSFARGWFRAWANRAEPYRRLDCTAPGLAMVHVYERTGDSLVAEAAYRLATYLISRPTLGGVFATWEASPLRHPYGPGELPPAEVRLAAAPPPGVFVDCLHFDPPFFTALGRALGDERLREIGVEQAIGYIRLLQDPQTGLFHHFVLEGQAQPYALGWGRGQGWALLGLLDVLENIDADHPSRDQLVVAAAALVRAMVAHRRDDGDWYAVVQVPSSGDETSTAAFMASGFVRAATLGAVPHGEIAEPARQALRAVLRNVEGPILTGVSAAVWACTQLSHYSHVSRGHVVPWGQGPLTLALAESLRVDSPLWSVAFE